MKVEKTSSSSSNQEHWRRPKGFFQYIEAMAAEILGINLYNDKKTWVDSSKDLLKLGKLEGPGWDDDEVCFGRFPFSFSFFSYFDDFTAWLLMFHFVVFLFVGLVIFRLTPFLLFGLYALQVLDWFSLYNLALVGLFDYGPFMVGGSLISFFNKNSLRLINKW